MKISNPSRTTILEKQVKDLEARIKSLEDKLEGLRLNGTISIEETEEEKKERATKTNGGVKYGD